MPHKKLKLIKAWVEIHQEDLMADWKLAVEGQQPHKIELLREKMLKVIKVSADNDYTLFHYCPVNFLQGQVNKTS